VILTEDAWQIDAAWDEYLFCRAFLLELHMRTPRDEIYDLPFSAVAESSCSAERQAEKMSNRGKGELR